MFHEQTAIEMGLAHIVIKDCNSIPDFQFGFLSLTALLFPTLPQCSNTADTDKRISTVEYKQTSHKPKQVI